MTNQDLISALSAPFPPEELRKRPGGGGIMLDYIDWIAALDRLNNEVGMPNWDFTLGEVQMIGDAQAGYAICRGQMTVRFPEGQVATKSAYGGCAYGQGGKGMSPDDAAKGAGSDAFKKCATLFNVAIDLARKDAPQNGGFNSNYGGGSQGGYGGGNRQQSYQQPSNQGGGFTNGQAGFSDDGEPLYCEECGEPLTETRFKDGTNWAPEQLAVFGRRKHSRVLCMTHYREANQARRRAEEALQQAPF